MTKATRDQIDLLRSECQMRFNWTELQTVNSVSLMRRFNPHFRETFKGTSDADALEIVQNFLTGAHSKRYFERKAIWEAYWARA